MTRRRRCRHIMLMPGRYTYECMLIDVVEVLVVINAEGGTDVVPIVGTTTCTLHVRSLSWASYMRLGAAYGDGIVIRRHDIYVSRADEPVVVSSVILKCL